MTLRSYFYINAQKKSQNISRINFHTVKRQSHERGDKPVNSRKLNVTRRSQPISLIQSHSLSLHGKALSLSLSLLVGFTCLISAQTLIPGKDKQWSLVCAYHLPHSSRECHNCIFQGEESKSISSITLCYKWWLIDIL